MNYTNILGIQQTVQLMHLLIKEDQKLNQMRLNIFLKNSLPLIIISLVFLMDIEFLLAMVQT